VLVDFPRNINQAKKLELMFTGYELNTDVAKPFEAQNYETWTKFTDPFYLTSEDFDPKVEAQPSLFDIFFILNSSSEECKRRAQHRKIDSAAGTIYHMEDSPPPEDSKLREKLTDYFGNYPSAEEMIMKMDSNHI
jgi:hypothetical protein